MAARQNRTAAILLHLCFLMLCGRRILPAKLFDCPRNGRGAESRLSFGSSISAPLRLLKGTRRRKPVPIGL